VLKIEKIIEQRYTHPTMPPAQCERGLVLGQKYHIATKFGQATAGQYKRWKLTRGCVLDVKIPGLDRCCGVDGRNEAAIEPTWQREARSVEARLRDAMNSLVCILAGTPR
jgi:hypothetical protein